MGCCRPSTETVAFLYNIINTLNIAVMPQLLLRKLCLRETLITDQTCVDEKYMFADIHRKASKWWFYLQLTVQIPSIFTIILSGPITDKLGRRKSLLVITLLDICALVVFMINAYFMDLHPAFIIPGYLLMSLFGASDGVFYLCYTFVADITKHNLQERTPRMVLIQLSGELAGFIGGLFSGYLLQTLNYASVFLFSIGIHGLILFYISWCLSKFDEENSGESIQLTTAKEEEELEDTDNDERECLFPQSPNSSLDGIDSDSNDDTNEEISLLSRYKKHMKVIAFMMRERSVMLPMLIANLFIIFGYRGETLLQTLYLKNFPFYFNSLNIGYFFGTQSGSRVIGSLILILLSSYCIRCSDYVFMIIGAFSQALSFVLVGLARTRTEVFIGSAVSFAVPLCYASLRSFMTKSVNSDQHAAVISFIYSLNAFSTLITNIVSSTVYRSTLRYYSGIVFYGLGGISAAAMVLIILSYIAFRYRS